MGDDKKGANFSYEDPQLRTDFAGEIVNIVMDALSVKIGKLFKMMSDKTTQSLAVL